VEGHVDADGLAVTGTSPQYDVEGAVRLRGDEKTWSGDLSGRIYVYSDGTAESDDLSLDLGDVVLSLRFRGTVIATSDSGATEASYHIAGQYKLTGAQDVDLVESGDVTAIFRVKDGDASSLELDLVGQEPS
jgi:hypothetical protein